MKTGVVKFFNEEKGYGFITQDNGSDLFVHVSGTQEEIQKNDRVEFDVEDGRKGPTAVNVKLA